VTQPVPPDQIEWADVPCVVPLVVYTDDGRRVVVGTAEIVENKFRATIGDENTIALFDRLSNNEAFSIDFRGMRLKPNSVPISPDQLPLPIPNFKED
jgi:hypothetical protein